MADVASDVLRMRRVKQKLDSVLVSVHVIPSRALACLLYPTSESDFYSLIALTFAGNTTYTNITKIYGHSYDENPRGG